MPSQRSVEAGPVYGEDGTPLEYIIVVDAGSKGTRAFVYNWQAPEASSQSLTLPRITLNAEWNKKVRPSLDALVINNWNDAANIENYLDHLLAKIFRIVPREQHHRTPIFVQGTAGLRVIMPELQSQIMGTICLYLKSNTDFFLPDCSTHINIIEGDEEALYGWVAANYLMGKTLFDPHFGILEMGGGSAQLGSLLLDTSTQDYFKLQLGNLETIGADTNTPTVLHVATQSFGMYGFNSFHHAYLQNLLSTQTSPLLDPCLPSGFSKQASINNYKYHLNGLGDAEKCQQAITDLLPDHMANIPDGQYLAVSGYWDTLSQLLNVKGNEAVYEAEQIEAYTNKVCQYSDLDLAQNYPQLKESDRINLCFKSRYILEIMERLGSPQHVQVTDHMGDFDFTWTLGRALLYALDEQALANGTPRVGFSKSHSPRLVHYGSEQAGVEGRPKFELFGSYKQYHFQTGKLDMDVSDSWWYSNSTVDDDSVYNDMEGSEQVRPAHMHTVVIIAAVVVLLAVGYFARRWLNRIVLRVRTLVPQGQYSRISEGSSADESDPFDINANEEDLDRLNKPLPESFELDNIIRETAHQTELEEFPDFEDDGWDSDGIERAA